MSTHGLCAFEGKFHVFAITPVAIADTNFVVHVLSHPVDPAIEIVRIHFAAPFLRHLYVVAEFADGDVYHYWLQVPDPWEPNTPYSANALVSPTIPGAGGGLVFRATRLGGAYPSWTAETPRTIGDRIEPTIFNGFYYECTATTGDNPRSQAIEPIWAVAAGGITIESPEERGTTDGGTGGTPPTPPPDDTPGPETTDIYWSHVDFLDEK